MDDEETIPQAATRLGVNRSVLVRAVNGGKLAARRVGAKIWVVKRDDAEVFVMHLQRRPGRKKEGA
jgi:excisionase family DNA binding protein